jgi:uncharacterized protein (UPF0548 family)
MAKRVERLDPAVAAELRAAPYSYPEVGGTRQDQLPPGYRADRFGTVAGRGRDRFDEVAELLMSWQVHLRAGLAMQVSDDRVSEGAVLMATLRLGPFPIRTRCRVVYLIEEDNRRGFAYGTLPGHPERGEEQFLVESTDDQTVRFRLTAFSRSATPLARLGGPVSRRIQVGVNRRYLDAVQGR